MFLQSGRIQKKLYPGKHGEHVEKIMLSQNVNQLFVVMNGFDLSFERDAHYIKNIVVNLWVEHKAGEDTAELHCWFQLNDADSSGDLFYALCDYLLIGKI